MGSAEPKPDSNAFSLMGIMGIPAEAYKIALEKLKKGTPLTERKKHEDVKQVEKLQSKLVQMSAVHENAVDYLSTIKESGFLFSYYHLRIVSKTFADFLKKTAPQVTSNEGRMRIIEEILTSSKEDTQLQRTQLYQDIADKLSETKFSSWHNLDHNEKLVSYTYFKLEFPMVTEKDYGKYIQSLNHVSLKPGGAEFIRSILKYSTADAMRVWNSKYAIAPTSLKVGGLAIGATAFSTAAYYLFGMNDFTGPLATQASYTVLLISGGFGSIFELIRMRPVLEQAARRVFSDANLIANEVSLSMEIESAILYDATAKLK